MEVSVYIVLNAEDGSLRFGVIGSFLDGKFSGIMHDYLGGGVSGSTFVFDDQFVCTTDSDGEVRSDDDIEEAYDRLVDNASEEHFTSKQLHEMEGRYLEFNTEIMNYEYIGKVEMDNNVFIDNCSLVIPYGLGNTTFIDGYEIDTMTGEEELDKVKAIEVTSAKKLTRGLQLEGDVEAGSTIGAILPEGLYVGGDLDLEYSDIQEIPYDITVRGKIKFRNSSVLNYPWVARVGPVKRDLYIDIDDEKLIHLGCVVLTKEKAMYEVQKKYKDKPMVALQYCEKIEECFALIEEKGWHKKRKENLVQLWRSVEDFQGLSQGETVLVSDGKSHCLATYDGRLKELLVESREFGVALIPRWWVRLTPAPSGEDRA